jgi:hypothetical protein
MMVEGPISPLSPGDSTNTGSSAYSSDNSVESLSVGRSHRYKVAMTARARQRRMRRMIEKTDDERAVISPDSRRTASPASVKYTERSLSASRRRSNSNPRKAAAAFSAASPTSKESSTKATPKRSNTHPVNGSKNVYVHEIPTAMPNTPNPSFPRSSPAFPTSAFPTMPDITFHTPGNDTNVTEEEIVKSTVDQAWSEATTPSILMREEIFHHKAAANIVRLLTPDRMFHGTLPESSGAVFDETADANDALATETARPGLTDTFQWNSFDQMTFKKEFAQVPDDEDEIMRRALTTRMIGPNQQLADLLSQINRDVKTTPEIGRAYATRRKNACGALKVLSSKEENRLKLCWTTGMLDAISSVLNDVKTPTLDGLSFNANTEARNRIVNTLQNLAADKRNRMLICNTAGVLDAIKACIAGDEGESRQGCCIALLQLAKSSDTRPLIIRCPGLLDALAKVIEVPKVVPPSPVGMPSRRGYENPYLKIFESHLSPGEDHILSDPSQSFISPNDTALSPEDTMYSQQDSTFTDSDVESPRSPGHAISPNDTTLSPDESMYRHDEVTDTEDDASSVSSYSSCSSKSGSETHGSHAEHTEHTEDHTEDHTEGHTESSESEEHSKEHANDECLEENPLSHGPGRCIIIQSMSEMEICFKSHSDSDEKQEDDYDSDPNQFLHGARLNIFGCLLLLVKSKENAVSTRRTELCDPSIYRNTIQTHSCAPNLIQQFEIARAEPLVKALIDVSKKQKSPAHSRALTILAHLTRHPMNCHHLTFHYIQLLPMLQTATESSDADARKYALRALQNLSMNNSCKTTIAHTDKMIASLTDRCNGETNEEVHAAVATIQNLSDEPANLIQFTIVRHCIGTVMSIARSNKARMDEGIETKFTQFMAQNTLAKLSYWLRKIATSSSQRMCKDVRSQAGAAVPLYDAVLQPIDYEQWK